jgi:hypothetical protein
MLIQRAVLLDGTHTDIRLDASIGEVAAGLTPRRGEDVLDAAGGTVLPGLHDHHLHLRAAAAAMASIHVGPDVVSSRQDLRRILSAASTGADGWIRAVGYHDAAAGELDRGVLDEVCPTVPVRVQHRSGVLWMLNSPGLQRLGLDDHPDGRLRRRRCRDRNRSWRSSAPGCVDTASSASPTPLPTSGRPTQRRCVRRTGVASCASGCTCWPRVNESCTTTNWISTS